MQTNKLLNGVEMPVIGIGTYQLAGDILKSVLQAGLEATGGSLLIDSAHSYPNETDIGHALSIIFKEGSYKRDNVFLTSKIGDKLENGFPIGEYFYNTDACPNHDTKAVVVKQFEEILKDLNSDYLDLLLIHWPYNDALEDIWDAMESLYKKGVVRAIGVSNCRDRHLNRLIKSGSVVPMVNQIYVSPFNTQNQTRVFCDNKNIQVETYSPLHGISNNAFSDNKNIIDICRKYNKSLVQVIIRWNYQHVIIPIPKSNNPFRIKSNFKIFDFELTSAEMAIIDSFNTDYQLLPESRYCPGY